MEALQLAQMLADLNDLQAAQDQTAAKALVNANKTLSCRGQSQTLAPSSKSNPESPVLAPNGGRRASDKFGRHLLTPPLSRTNSGTPSSVPGTPNKDHSMETDISRASTLLTLYEIRAKLKEQDSSSLQKAREKVNALAARQAQIAAERRQTAGFSQKDAPGSNRISYPK
ncbi:hypothetical protein DL771_011842 [Monosporascus sp. 5C6A]|nr:hypothetical protein DL771_011842 [Monosporascus sp. 5C6A]